MPKKATNNGKTKNARKQGKTQISISLSADLVARIDTLATAQNRNRSNYIANELEMIASKTLG